MSDVPSGRNPIDGATPQPVRRREPKSSQLVRVSLPENSDVAVVYSEGRVIDATYAAAALSKRFRPGEARSGYFRSELFDDGVLEIGERVSDPDPRW